MDAIEAVTKFINHAVVNHRRERYLGFISGAKSRHKFLDALDHLLASQLDESLAVGALSEAEWRQPGYLYSSDGIFGGEIGSLRDGYEHAPDEGGWLIVGQSASAAIFRPEGRIDDELYFRL